LQLKLKLAKMKNIFTKITTTLLLSLTLAFSVTAQNFKYKVGDKVEIFYGRIGIKAQVTRYYGNMYTLKEESTGLTFYLDDSEIRSIGGSPSKDANSNTTAVAMKNNTKKEVPISKLLMC
jgi:hypothetical protein